MWSTGSWTQGTLSLTSFTHNSRPFASASSTLASSWNITSTVSDLFLTAKCVPCPPPPPPLYFVLYLSTHLLRSKLVCFLHRLQRDVVHIKAHPFRCRATSLVAKYSNAGECFSRGHGVHHGTVTAKQSSICCDWVHHHWRETPQEDTVYIMAQSPLSRAAFAVSEYSNIR